MVKSLRHASESNQTVDFNYQIILSVGLYKSQVSTGMLFVQLNPSVPDGRIPTREFKIREHKYWTEFEDLDFNFYQEA